jgi:hypothetical protein
MPGWYEDGEWIEDCSDWTDEDFERDAESTPPWAGRPDLADLGDERRKAIKEQAL